MTTKTLRVPDISCEHCERTVKQALEPVDGVTSVSVNIPAKQVRVTFDETRVGVEKMRTILADEDYPVASVA